MVGDEPVLQLEGEGRVVELAGLHPIDVLVGRHGRLVLGVAGQHAAGHDAALAQIPHTLLPQVVQPAANAAAPVLGQHGNARAVVPGVVGIVLARAVVAGDLRQRVVGCIEREVDEQPEADPDGAVAVEHHEVAFGEVGRQLGDTVGVVEILGIDRGEHGVFDRREFVGAVDGDSLVAQFAHGKPIFSNSLWLGRPQHAQNSRVRGRITTAPDDSTR